MIKKIVIFLFFSYILILLEMSFFPHFLSFLPNLLFLTVILINFLEDQKEKSGFYFAFLAGILSDVFSQRFFGFYVLVYLFSAIFIKFILKTHFQFAFKLRHFLEHG